MHSHSAKKKVSEALNPADQEEDERKDDKLFGSPNKKKDKKAKKSEEEEDDGGENDDEIRVSLPVWEFVAKIPDPEWCWNNHIENIEYNRRTGEYRYTTLDPWHEQYAWA